MVANRGLLYSWMNLHIPVLPTAFHFLLQWYPISPLTILLFALSEVGEEVSLLLLLVSFSFLLFDLFLVPFFL